MLVQDVKAGLCYAAHIFLKVESSPVYLTANLFINLSSACFTWMSNFHPHIHQATACIQNVAHSRLAVVGRCIA